MTFVNVKHLNLSTKLGMSAAYVALRPSGACTVPHYVSREQPRVTVEIDPDTRQLRLKFGEEGSMKLTGKSRVGFNLAKRIAMSMLEDSDGKQKYVPLQLQDDGWWYGCYDGRADPKDILPKRNLKSIVQFSGNASAAQIKKMAQFMLNHKPSLGEDSE